MASTTANQKKSRLGGLFAPKSPAPPGITANNNRGELPVAPNSGSKGAGTASANNTNITPIENHGQVSGVDTQRNLAVNERTGEVLDDDTGEVLTTVTTTTTTTTTTHTRRARSRSPQPPANSAASDEVVQETTTKQQQQKTSQLLDPSSAARPTHSISQNSQSSGSTLAQTPSNSSVGKSSYDANQQQQSANQWPISFDENAPRRSAIENLKSAATGLQDVRNSLKSTYHEASPLPVPRRNPARSGRAPSYHQPPNQPPPPPSQQHPSGHPPSLVPGPHNNKPLPSYGGGANTGQSQWQAPWPEPPSSESTMEDSVGDHEGLKKRKSLSSMPQSFSPESSGQLGREKSPRLFKRSKNKKGLV